MTYIWEIQKNANEVVNILENKAPIKGIKCSWKFYSKLNKDGFYEFTLRYNNNLLFNILLYFFLLNNMVYDRPHLKGNIIKTENGCEITSSAFNEYKNSSIYVFLTFSVIMILIFVFSGIFADIEKWYYGAIIFSTYLAIQIAVFLHFYFKHKKNPNCVEMMSLLIGMDYNRTEDN